MKLETQFLFLSGFDVVPTIFQLVRFGKWRTELKLQGLETRARVRSAVQREPLLKKKKTYSSFAEPLALFTRLQIFER